MKKLLCRYSADAGTFVVNGIGINNGIGDGSFGVYFTNKVPDGANLIKDLWIDLRNGYDIVIHTYDCNKRGNEYEPNIIIPREKFGKAQALQVAVDMGTIYFVKYF